MNKTKKAFLSGLSAIAFAGSAVANVDNGSFETGDFTSWDTSTSGAALLSVSDVNPGGCAASLPSNGITDGVYAAYLNMSGPNTIVIWQDFLVPADGFITLDLTYSNANGWGFTGVLDHTVETTNQHLRVDIMDPAASDLSMDPADIYLTVFETDGTSPLTLDMVPLSADVGALAGQTVRVRVAKVDNSGCFTTVVDNVQVAGGTNSANFNVTKTFTNGDTGDVEVTLTCNGGIPLVQSFTISGGGPGVTFTVTDLPDAGANCAVTESGGNEGYAADLSACSWTGVTGGFYSCPIENVPEATTVSVNTVIDTDGEATIDPTFTTTIVCENVSADTGPTFGTVTVEDTSGTFEADWYADPVNGTDCTVTLVPNDMAVEGSTCSFSFDIGDAEAGCDVEGTVFFEGIPTLSQYGMAIMVLLMLGVGFVGFRRFV